MARPESIELPTFAFEARISMCFGVIPAFLGLSKRHKTLNSNDTALPPIFRGFLSRW